MLGIFFFLILGLIIGSFLNAVIYRLHVGQSIADGRSKCTNCQHQLSFLDLIPIFSFIFLGGKCRYCRAKISWQYPLVELASALLFVWSYLYFGGSDLMVSNFWSLIMTLLLICFGLVILVFDLRYYLIAEIIVWPIISITFLASLFIFHLSWVGLALSAATICLFFWLQIVLSKGKWLGDGDILLGLLLGVALGWPRALVGLILAYWLGAIVSLFLVAFKKKDFSSKVPFGPFLILGLWLAWFFGSWFLKWLYV